MLIHRGAPRAKNVLGEEKWEGEGRTITFKIRVHLKKNFKFHLVELETAEKLQKFLLSGKRNSDFLKLNSNHRSQKGRYKVITYRSVLLSLSLPQQCPISNLHNLPRKPSSLLKNIQKEDQTEI